MSSEDGNEYHLQYGIDYDYIVESFSCEFKVDKKAIKAILEQYQMSEDEDERAQLLAQFNTLYPEGKCTDLRNVTPDRIPDKVVKTVYFVQSPKGSNGLPSIHYSLKEKMLSDMRAKRSAVKKQMAEAEHKGDKVGAVRFNAKQLAIKVVCNAEYGASGNEFFAHYDPDVAASVTFAARQLIGFLTNNLEADHLYIDQKFYDQNKAEIENLAAIGCIKCQPYTGTPQHLFKERRHVLRRIFDENYNVVCDNVIEVLIKKSTVAYQDTDSNYYFNKYITDYFIGPPENRHCSPDIIDECMHRMLDHNNLLANFARDTVQRRPTGLGFEGSFVVARYLNRKKKYYGFKWSPDGEWIPAKRLSKPEAYVDGNIEKGILVDDYDKVWYPKKTVIPMSTGEYIRMDDDKLLRQGVNYLDYVKDYGIKCTGVDLARRDQYMFINYFHIRILKYDLRLMKYLGGGNWEMFSQNEPMMDVITNSIEEFRSTISRFNDIAAFKFDNDTAGTINFRILDFAKNGAYRDNKATATTIVNRIKAEVERHPNKFKESLIPREGDRVQFVTILDEATMNERLDGRSATDNVSARSLLVKEHLFNIMSKLYEEYCRSENIKPTDLTEVSDEERYDIVFEAFKHKCEQCSVACDKNKELFDEWLNAKAIAELDFKYYLTCLCKSIALYVLGDFDPVLVKAIDDGEYTPAEAGKLVSKAAEKFAKSQVDKYFRSGRSVLTAYNQVEREVKKYVAKQPVDMNMLYVAFKNLPNPITPAARNQVAHDINKNIERYRTAVDAMTKIYKSIATNTFLEFKPKPIEVPFYERYRDDLTGLLKQIELCSKKLSIYEKLSRIVDEIKFNGEVKAGEVQVKNDEEEEKDESDDAYADACAAFVG